MARKIVDSSALFDTLDNVGGNGEFVTICYMMGVTIGDDFMEKRKNPLTNRMKNFPNFERISSELNTVGLSGFIMLAKYQLHWSSKTNMDKLYGKYKDSANQIRQNFGIEPIKNSDNVSHQTINYGGGVVVGNTPNTMGRTYSMQNGATAKKKYTYYGVDGNGNIIREFAKEEVSKYLKYSNKGVDGLTQLKKLNATQEVLDDYTEQIKALNFTYKKFEADHILYAVGTSDDNEKFFFINDHLIDNVGGVNVNTTQLRDIARAKCKEDYNIVAENMNRNKNKISLTESQLHRVIRESVNRVLSEMRQMNARKRLPNKG